LVATFGAVAARNLAAHIRWDDRSKDLRPFASLVLVDGDIGKKEVTAWT
jgi:hypothetical protein